MFNNFRSVILVSVLIITPAHSHLPSGASNESISQNLSTLVSRMNKKQKALSIDSFDSKQKSVWHYVPKRRKGAPLSVFDKAERKYVLNSLKKFLSHKGFVDATTIMNLESILREEEMGFVRRDPLGYYLEIFGNPNPKGVWAMSFEGHHLSLNYVVENDKIVSFSPMFFGANPATVTKSYGVGPKKGTKPLSSFEVLAFELLNSLNSKQRAKAVVSSSAIDDVRDGGDSLVPAYEQVGLPAHNMNENQYTKLKKLVDVYLEMLPKGTTTKIKQISANSLKNQTFFSWNGATKPGVGHYYRIDHPQFVIELANTQSDVSGNPANHVHALWRTRN